MLAEIPVRGRYLGEGQRKGENLTALLVEPDYRRGQITLHWESQHAGSTGSLGADGGKCGDGRYISDNVVRVLF